MPSAQSYYFVSESVNTMCDFGIRRVRTNARRRKQRFHNIMSTRRICVVSLGRDIAFHNRFSRATRLSSRRSSCWIRASAMCRPVDRCSAHWIDESAARVRDARPKTSNGEPQKAQSCVPYTISRVVFHVKVYFVET